MVSMKDIALRCNVSVATVSKALNGYSDIGKKRREEILRTAKEMGYFPNCSARALKTNRTYNLGVLFSDNMKSGLTHDYFAAILDSFKVAAELRGYDITFTSMGMVANRRMSYYEHCRYRGLDGVVIANIDFTSPDAMELIGSDLPVVTIDAAFDNIPSVVSDNVRGMKDLTQYVLSMGHRKIAYIYGDENSVTRDRLDGFFSAMKEGGAVIPEDYLLPSRYRDMELTRQRMKELLNRKDRPTCVLLPDDYSSVGAYGAIIEQGLRIPEDVSVAGYDGITMSQVMFPKLTTLRQDTASIGQIAAQRLIGLIEEPEKTGTGRILIEGKLVEGDSVKKL